MAAKKAKPRKTQRKTESKRAPAKKPAKAKQPERTRAKRGKSAVDAMAAEAEEQRKLARGRPAARKALRFVEVTFDAALNDMAATDHGLRGAAKDCRPASTGYNHVTKQRNIEFEVRSLGDAVEVIRCLVSVAVPLKGPLMFKVRRVFIQK